MPEWYDECSVCGKEFEHVVEIADSLCPACAIEYRICECCFEPKPRSGFRELEGEEICGDCWEYNAPDVYVSDGGTKPDPVEEEEEPDESVCAFSQCPFRFSSDPLTSRTCDSSCEYYTGDLND